MASDQVGDRLGHGTIPVLRGVLVDQRGAGRSVPQSRHQFTRARPGRGGKRVPGVAKIVGPHSRDPDGGDGFAPRPVEGHPVDGITIRSREHEGIGIRRDVGVEVRIEIGKHMRWNGHGSLAGIGLGRTEPQRSVP